VRFRGLWFVYCRKLRVRVHTFELFHSEILPLIGLLLLVLHLAKCTRYLAKYGYPRLVGTKGIFYADQLSTDKQPMGGFGMGK